MLCCFTFFFYIITGLYFQFCIFDMWTRKTWGRRGHYLIPWDRTNYSLQTLWFSHGNWFPKEVIAIECTSQWVLHQRIRIFFSHQNIWVCLSVCQVLQCHTLPLSPWSSQYGSPWDWPRGCVHWSPVVCIKCPICSLVSWLIVFDELNVLYLSCMCPVNEQLRYIFCISCCVQMQSFPL